MTETGNRTYRGYCFGVVNTMGNNFGTVWYTTHEFNKRMLNGLLDGLKNAADILPINEKDLRYARLEIYLYLLFWLSTDMKAKQQQHICDPLFDYLVGEIFNDSKVEGGLFGRTAKKRLEEYSSIFTSDIIYPSMFDGPDTEPNKMHSFESLFIENLAFSVINEDCYYYEGNLDTRPFAVLQATRMWLMHTIYRASLHRLFLAFVVFTNNLFGANSDFTKLSRKELKNIEENVIKELQQLGI